MIRILIADDHCIVREGLKQIVADMPDMTVSGEADNGQGVLELVRENAGDVVLLDINMPGRGGLDTLKDIKDVNSQIPVLMLSMYSEDRYAIRALRAGAAGYMTKDSAPDSLIGAIRKISVGRKYISSSLAEKLAINIGNDIEKPRHETLSDREHQVFIMIANGKTISQIAENVRLSTKTVSTYRSRVLMKMRMNSNAELMQYAFRNKLTE
jgi:two-component system invasion response regulator UvrY